MTSLRERATMAFSRKVLAESEAAEVEKQKLVGRDPNKLKDVLLSAPAAFSAIEHSVNAVILYNAARLVAPPEIRKQMPPVLKTIFSGVRQAHAARQ